MEMNAIFSIGLQSMEELIQLCPVPTQIISPCDSKPITAVVQDVATGLFRLTKNHVRINERQFMNMMSNITKFNGEMPKPHDAAGYHGRQALSMILPDRVNVTMQTDNYDDDMSAEDKLNHKIVIKNGEVLSGAIFKDVYQGRTKGVIHSVFNEYGPDETRQLYDNTQKLICDWLVYDGFSTGISDIIIPDSITEQFKKITHDMKVQAYEIIRQIHEGKFANNSTKNNYQLFEEIVNNQILNRANNEVGKLALKQINDRFNRLLNMINSKSKGKMLNVAQIIGCVGQQNVEGRRIPYGFEDRTLPHYTKYDDGPESRGFVESSFIKGLTPQEFFFHAMGGREGLIDTAVNSVTGDTPIVIIENGAPKYVKIGDWIDAYLDNPTNKDKVKFIPEQANLEMFNLDQPVYIPTTDANGNVSWEPLTAVTRHDPGERLFEITTHGGRSVIVAESKSLLIWDDATQSFQMKHSPDVKIGDFAPVTANLPAPPVTIQHVDMADYFPKTQYVHGTEFNKAVNLMKAAQGSKFHIPRRWYAENNGNTFTLPYTSKARLQRVISGRSNTEIIMDGCIYPYHAKRDACLIPDKFELNKEFGIFIGLYIAEGSTCVKSGKVNIANVDRKIKDFVHSWFGKYRIVSWEETREMKVTPDGKLSTTSSVNGNSTLLARFLDKFVGHGAHNKFIPDVAYAAPHQFIVGLLNGYMAGDGSVSRNSITSSSASKRLTEGISLLCSRIGVFGKMSVKTNVKSNLRSSGEHAPAHLLDIRSKWCTKFAEQVDNILDYKAEALLNVNCTKEHINFTSHNDVVLDAIKEIKVLSVDKYPKLYDVTVPSTLNFMIHNGLQVVDTSETGYIQRKLVKAMEDCKVNYDMTVRNAAGVIVQYLYGEDGMDACKIESQGLPHMDMDLDKIQATYGLVDGVNDFKSFLDPELFAALKKDSAAFEKRMAQHHARILEDREHVIVKMNNGAYEGSILYPVALNRILVTIQNTYSKYGANVPHDLDPNYILDQIDILSQELSVTKHYPGNRLFQILLRAYLTPKRILINHRLTKKAFDTVLEQIRFRFFEALVNPSEMVGVIAAQSIGEPSTQLVLNSVSYDTELLINRAGRLERVQIGKLIDDYMSATPADKIENHPNDTKLAYTNEDIKIQSCDENGMVSWKAIEAVTRHPVVNEDGTNTVLKVTLLSGRSVIATKAKSFLKRVDNKIQPVEGKDLKVGDYLQVSKILPTIKNKNVTQLQSLDVSEYLPKSKFLYMSEVQKGLSVYGGHGSFWWRRNHTKTFTTPYKRSDTFTAAWVSKLRAQTMQYKAGCVYPFPSSIVTSTIPEHIPLDNNFGFIVGAYLSEGCVCSSQPKENENRNQNHVLIANVDAKFNDRVIKFANDYNIGYHIDKACKNNGLSMTVRLHSTILATLLELMCGNGSPNKRVPAFVMQAPDEFVKGVVDGYFSGDGQFHKRINFISAFSSSHGLLEDMQLLLTRFGVMSNIEFKNLQSMRDKNPDSVIRDGWQLYIKREYTKVFAENFDITLDYKQDRLSEFDQKKFTHMNKHMWNIVPDVVLSTGTTNVDLYNLDKMIQKTKTKADKEVLLKLKQENIIYDPIVDIEEIANPTPYVYDLTIAKTRTFNTYSNICQYDTFHSSGVSSASKAVRGVPRLNELLAVSKNIKTPEMRIYVKPSSAGNKLECMDIMNNIRTIKFKHIISSSSIFYDPSDENTSIMEDRGMIDSYKEFMEHKSPTPWVLRLELNRDEMLNFKLDMITLYFVLSNFYGDKVSIIFSDDNADKLIMRIRINNTAEDMESDDILTDLKALEHNIIESVPIRGVRNIHRVALQEHKSKAYNSQAKVFEDKKEWMIYTEGSNIRDVIALPIVDGPRCLTNDINEIYEVLGVEAARQALYNEIVEVLDTVKVNYRHIALLVDVMTNRGNILAVNRHGINRGDIGPLAKCSFEETTDKLIKAGVYAEYDNIKGVSANVMLGQIAPCGTGDVTVIMDNFLVSQMPDNEAVSVQKFVMDDEAVETACSPEVLKMDMPTPAPLQHTERKLDNDFVFV